MIILAFYGGLVIGVGVGIFVMALLVMSRMKETPQE